MTITTTKLTRAAGLAAVAGGLLFIAVQINHPHLDADLRHHDRVRGPRNHEDRDGRPVGHRHHRDLPAPGQADRSARPARVPAVRGRLPRHSEHPGRRLVRPPVPRGHSARLRQRRPRRGRRRHRNRRHRRAGRLHPDRRVHLPGRRPRLRHRPLPRPRPPPLGCRTPRRRQRRHRHDPPAAADQPDGCSPSPSPSPSRASATPCGASSAPGPLDP